MLCNSCQQRQATCHITEIVDGVEQARDLCSECWEASSPIAEELVEAQRNARCEYCGGQPCAGGTDFLAILTGVQKQKWMCMPCSTEHDRFVQERMQHADSGWSQQRQIAWFRELDEKADKHMKLWVAEKGRE